MKCLHLHFGTHRTGSTSIQAYLAGNKDFFASMGFSVVGDFNPLDDPDAGMRFGTNCFRIAHVVIRPSLNTPMRMIGGCRILTGEQRESAIHSVNAAISAERHDDVIISAEALSFLRTTEEHDCFDRMFGGMKRHPIGFLRDKMDWLRSWRAQLTNQSLICHPNAEPGMGIFDLSPNSWLVQHETIRSFFGPEGSFFSYEDEMARNGTVLPAFLESIGLDPSRCPDWRSLWENNSGATVA
jgi:hypothetical protein